MKKFEIEIFSLINLGQQALKMVDRSGVFASKYENGDRSPDLIYQYILFNCILTLMIGKDASYFVLKKCL